MKNSDKKVLLMAEDDLDDRLFFWSAFQNSPASPDLRFVTDGVQLLDYLLHRGNFTSETAPMPDVIILDLNMPKINGRTALTEIRKVPALNSIPVVVLTTSEAEEDMDYCKKAGVCEYFIKPRTIEGYLEIVEYLSKFC